MDDHKDGKDDKDDKDKDIQLSIQSQLELRINAYWYSLFPSIFLEVV